MISLAVVFYLVDFRKVLTALKLADYRLVALSILITVLWLAVRAQVWRTLLQEKASFGQVFSTVNEGYLLNNILPFRLGEIGRSFLLAQKANLEFFEVFSTILIERAMDVAFAAGFLLITLPFVVGGNWAFQAAIGAAIFVILGLSALYLLARFNQQAANWFEKTTEKWPALQRIGSLQLRSFLLGLSVLTDGRRFFQALGWMLINWGIAFVQYYVLLLAFISSAEPLWAAFSLGVISLGIAAPSSPGALGVFELAMVFALSLFGISPSVALALALIAHFINYLTTGVLGAIALSYDGETLIGLYQRVRHIQVNSSPGSE